MVFSILISKVLREAKHKVKRHSKFLVVVGVQITVVLDLAFTHVFMLQILVLKNNRGLIKLNRLWYQRTSWNEHVLSSGKIPHEIKTGSIDFHVLLSQNFRVKFSEIHCLRNYFWNFFRLKFAYITFFKAWIVNPKLHFWKFRYIRVLLDSVLNWNLVCRGVDTIMKENWEKGVWS